ncbi:dTDP-4-dehydrorhamnose 3,5-epimerase [Thermosulfurimonas dismutans]|uniref:dTDP-4-dehydrorhamnose 3,5-epimerase n=1 Tax=Thermosulfurimonas dismutans TaxID=999894 RepID=A0A179D1J4_9BACT|nr:dTDP-4-dehydrorhamnose 3,5-epimerase [Thermosulfurimonas dismutans]OAQ19863.1 dTDP-4-dehydrorhamnose 3,5-epimerase [Thermosulfurimonas dismutans]
MPFTFTRLEIPDVILIEPKVFGDERGFFLETYKASEFRANGISYDFAQDNHSRSQKGVLRGLHYQLEPMEQGKLVRCIRGRIWDVAVDIRKGSPWFGKWVAAELSGENKLMLWIPPGFAHGFVALEDGTEILYKVTKEYAPELDRGIIWNDPDLAITWPVENPILSEKDSRLPNLKEAEINFVYGGKK